MVSPVTYVHGPVPVFDGGLEDRRDRGHASWETRQRVRVGEGAGARQGERRVIVTVIKHTSDVMSGFHQKIKGGRVHSTCLSPAESAHAAVLPRPGSWTSSCAQRNLPDVPIDQSATELTVVDEDVRAASRPVVGLDGCSPDVVGARQIDRDEVGLVYGQILLLEDGEELVVLGATPG